MIGSVKISKFVPWRLLLVSGIALSGLALSACGSSAGSATSGGGHTSAFIEGWNSSIGSGGDATCQKGYLENNSAQGIAGCKAANKAWKTQNPGVSPGEGGTEVAPLKN
jgi:hypothetical protein